MPEKKSRILYVNRYLEEHTDETCPATVAEILAYLREAGFDCGRKAVKGDIDMLMESGVDVICDKGRELRYFIGERLFETVELKLLIDAVQASRFIPQKKSRQLIQKITKLAPGHQAAQFDRHLLTDKLPKTTNDRVFYTADTLYTAIRDKQKVAFKYYEYNSRKEKAYKHNRKIYHFSPYHILWNSDCYYVLGYSDSHGKIVKFRVDRIAAPELRGDAAPMPEDYDPSLYVKSVFGMYDGSEQTDVTLKCENALMKSVIDRFGEDVETAVQDNEHFTAIVHISVSPTFYGWVFSFAGKMEIAAPQDAADGYRALARLAADKGR